MSNIITNISLIPTRVSKWPLIIFCSWRLERCSFSRRCTQCTINDAPSKEGTYWLHVHGMLNIRPHAPSKALMNIAAHPIKLFTRSRECSVTARMCFQRNNRMMLSLLYVETENGLQNVKKFQKLIAILLTQ